MFIGHVAAGLVGARQARMPLGTAVLAAQLPDVIDDQIYIIAHGTYCAISGTAARTALRRKSVMI